MDSLTLFWIVLFIAMMFIIAQMVIFWDSKPRYPKAYLERKKQEEEEREKEKLEQEKRRQAFSEEKKNQDE